MTTARAQPLLADSELTKARHFLFEAHMLVTDVRSVFFNSDDFAARLKDIEGRLADEFHAIERLIAASKPVFAIERGRPQTFSYVTSPHAADQCNSSGFPDLLRA